MSATTSTTPGSDPITTFLSRFGLRDVAHFLVPYAATIAALLGATSTTDLKSVGLAAIPGAAAVAFRQLFPHTTVSASEVGSAVTILSGVLDKVEPKATPVVTVVGQDVEKAVTDLTPAVPTVVPTAPPAAAAPPAAPTPPVAPLAK